MATYLDLYTQDEGMSKETLDKFPAGDDKVGKPKKPKQNLKAPFKDKIGKGGTKKTKEGTTTAGPDDRMDPADAHKAHPGFDSYK